MAFILSFTPAKGGLRKGYTALDHIRCTVQETIVAPPEMLILGAAHLLTNAFAPSKWNVVTQCCGITSSYFQMPEVVIVTRGHKALLLGY